MLLAVEVAVVVLALVLLGSVGFGLVGSVRRLRLEVEALARETEPLWDQAQLTAGRAAQTRDRVQNRG